MHCFAMVRLLNGHLVSGEVLMVLLKVSLKCLCLYIHLGILMLLDSVVNLLLDV